MQRANRSLVADWLDFIFTHVRCPYGSLRVRVCLRRSCPSQLVVRVHFDLQLLGDDLAVRVLVLVGKHVLDDALGVLSWPEATFALRNLSVDEGGELEEGGR